MPELTDDDRELITRARELAAIGKITVLRDRYRTPADASNEHMFADYWGESGHLLDELARRLERLGGD